MATNQAPVQGIPLSNNQNPFNLTTIIDDRFQILWWDNDGTSLLHNWFRTNGKTHFDYWWTSHHESYLKRWWDKNKHDLLPNNKSFFEEFANMIIVRELVGEKVNAYLPNYINPNNRTLTTLIDNSVSTLLPQFLNRIECFTSAFNKQKSDLQKISNDEHKKFSETCRTTTDKVMKEHINSTNSLVVIKRELGETSKNEMQKLHSRIDNTQMLLTLSFICNFICVFFVINK